VTAGVDRTVLGRKRESEQHLWIDCNQVVELGGARQGIDRCCVFAARIRAGERTVIAAQSYSAELSSSTHPLSRSGLSARQRESAGNRRSRVDRIRLNCSRPGPASTLSLPKQQNNPPRPNSKQQCYPALT
jgi:hypothetical protein